MDEMTPENVLSNTQDTPLTLEDLDLDADLAEMDAAEEGASDPVDLVERRMSEERKRAEDRALATELRSQVRTEERYRKILDTIRDLSPRIDTPGFEPVVIPPSSAPDHTWVVLLSDWQIGQQTTTRDSVGMFEQTSEIAHKQIAELWETILRLLELHGKEKSINEIVLAFLGDLVENDSMRPSQTREIDTLVTEQAVQASREMVWLIRQALARFTKVRVLSVGSNHGRTSPKAGNAAMGELGYIDTYEWLISHMVRDRFEDAVQAGRLKFDISDSYFGAARIAGQRVVYEHGASIKLSSPVSGVAPMTSVAVAGRNYQTMLNGADLVMIGHLHVPMVLPMEQGGHVIVNGALPPSSNYVQSRFKRVGRPSQTLLELHQGRGLTMWHPIYLDTSHVIKPGTFWDRIDAQENGTCPAPFDV